MIRVPVREHEEVELTDVFAQTLEPEFGRGVDLHVQTIHHDMHRGARAAVAGID